MEKPNASVTPPVLYEAVPWPVSWSAVFTGALAGIAAMTIFGLCGTALGASSLDNVKDFTTWHEVTVQSMAAVVIASFFTYVIAGWVAGKIVGAKYAEPGILHAAISWLVTIPMILVLLSIGAGKTFGGWYSGIISAVGTSANTGAALNPVAVHHTALAAVTVLLIGLIGSVIGGWMASGEPMTFTHHKTRSTSSFRPR